MNRKLLAALTAVVASPLVAGAQDVSGADLEDTIVVYGARLNQPLSEVGTSVSIITSEDLDALATDFVVDAIATAPGVTVNQNGGFGGVASVRIRGASSEQTLVLIDGVVTNDPSSPGGGYDFSRLDPANIERIEILKGPQSTLWGTDAIGGVVNIITKRPTEAFSANVFGEAGSYGTFRYGGALSGASGAFDYRLSATDFSTDGISKADEANGNTEEDAYDSTSVNASAGWTFGDDARLGANVLWSEAESEYDSFVFGAQGSVGDGDELSRTEELVADLSLQFGLFSGRLDNLLLAGYSDIKRESFTDGLPAFDSSGDRQLFRYQGTLAINNSNTLAFGAERETVSTVDDEVSIDGLFAFYELQATDALTLTAGVRRDDHEEFGSETTSRLAVAWNPLDTLTVHASWGQGFKAPSLFQTTFFCCGAVAPNPDVRPETSEGYDLGATFRTSSGRGEIGITWFDLDTDNLITFSFLDGGYANIAEATSNGIEMYGAYRFTDWMELSLSYAHIEAEDGAGMPLVRVPEDSGDLRLTLTPGDALTTTILLRYNGEEQDAAGVLDDWTRVDLSARYRLTGAVELYGRIENLFDEEYQQVLGYGTPDLSAYLGARFTFQ